MYILYLTYILINYYIKHFEELYSVRDIEDYTGDKYKNYF